MAASIPLGLKLMTVYTNLLIPPYLESSLIEPRRDLILVCLGLLVHPCPLCQANNTNFGCIAYC